MRHSRVEIWSRRDSPVHCRHAAAKILVILLALICIATSTQHTLPACAIYLAIFVLATALARLPIGALLKGAAKVFPFVLCFAAVCVIGGDSGRVVPLLARSYVSAYAALLLIATTPMPALIGGLEILRAPRFLLLVMQFLHRYLLVMLEEAGAMRDAGAMRGGALRILQLRQAAAAVGVLFARSYKRAQQIHLAMLSRGFDGHMPQMSRRSFTWRDAVFTTTSAALFITIRAALV